MSLKKQIEESVALDQQVKRRPRNFLSDRYNCRKKKLLPCFH